MSHHADDNSENFTCTMCDYATNSKRLFSRHIEDGHTDAERAAHKMPTPHPDDVSAARALAPWFMGIRFWPENLHRQPPSSSPGGDGSPRT